MSPPATMLPPAGIIPVCQPHVKMGVPLVHVTGSGSFYNFYNEDAMGNMVAGDYQLPSYRHILLDGAEDVRFYHFNPEHSVADANAEFRDSRSVSVFGTKSEGHSATIWVRNSTDVVHTGHSGNAKPLPCDPATCSTWTPSPCACDWAGVVSLFRVSGCHGDCRFGNLWTQSSKPERGSAAFPALWSHEVVTDSQDAPVVVVMSHSLTCAQQPGSDTVACSQTPGALPEDFRNQN